MTESNFEKNGGTYTQVGNYLIPDLVLPPEEQHIHLGVWGGRVSGGHLCQRQKHRPSRQARQTARSIFEKTSQGGLLWSADKRKAEWISCRSEWAGGGYVLSVVKQLVEKEGITETLKAENQMLWVQRMNAVREAAIEIVNNDLIYA